jgi:S-adenosylmethionine synthetase
VSYGIGLPHPLSVYVDTFKTGKLPDEAIQEAVMAKFDFRPGKIMQVGEGEGEAPHWQQFAPVCTQC